MNNHLIIAKGLLDYLPIMNILPMPLPVSNRHLFRSRGFELDSDLTPKLWTRIVRFLSDRDILNLCSCSHYFWKLIHEVEFTTKVNISQIMGLSYYDSFVNIECGCYIRILPAKLRYLDWQSDVPLPETPNSLTFLKLSRNCRCGLFLLPNSLTHLQLGYDYDQDLPSLPNSLTYLSLGHQYNRKLLSLPDSLTYLILGAEYDQDLPWFPNSIKYLKFGYNFNRLLARLPENLINLHLGFHYNQFLPPLPDSIECLELGYRFGKPIYNIPSSLKHLIITRNIQLPIGLHPNVKITCRF